MLGCKASVKEDTVHLSTPEIKTRNGWEEMFSGELYDKGRNMLHFVSLHIANNLDAHKSLLSDVFSVSELQKSMESSHLE